MESEIEEIVALSLKKAQEHDDKGNIGQAYAYYTAVLEFCPAKRAELEKRFTTILCEWGMKLEQNGRIKDVIKCYKNSLEIFPKNPTLLNNFAAHLLKQDEYLTAIKYLEQTVQVNPNFLPAVRNLQNAYSMAVDRWHFSMLNDRSRNCAFNEAIKKKVSLGSDTVLDIGTGTGLLSLYAQDAGAKRVYACECSPVMCDIAKKVFHHNKANNVNLICKPSTEIKISEDIPERVKLIVTEIFDAALFGELVIPTLIDAHKNLLAPNGAGIIIPEYATLYIAAVESEYIRFRSCVTFNESQSIGPLNFKNILILPDEEYYDTENLENVNVNYITEPKPILSVNFNDLKELENFKEDGVKEIISTACRYDGVVDGLVAWFKLNLDEEIQLDSSQGTSCWQLAVFPSFSQNVKHQDRLKISAQILNNRLKCSYELDSQNFNLHDQLTYKLPKEVIMFLNDKEYIKSLVDIAKSKREESIKTVFDICPFPVYGLTMLKENKHCEILYYQTENAALMHCIEHMINKNDIKKKIVFVSNFSDIVSTLDNIFVHNFDIKGELIDWGQQSYREVYSCLLSSTGTLLPEQIFLMGQLVYSEELSKMISVKDSNLKQLNESTKLDNKDIDIDADDCDEEYDFESTVTIVENSNLKSVNKYNVSQFINKFKINQVFDLNSSLYNYNAVSEVKTLIEMDDSEMKEEIINFGKINNAEKKENMPNALICWYKICLTQDHVHETRRTNSFMNYMAVVFENEMEEKITKGEEIIIKVQQMRDLVRISLQ